jgi:hypothetical protein
MKYLKNYTEIISENADYLSKSYQQALKDLQQYCDENKLEFLVEKDDILDEIDPHNLKTPKEKYELFVKKVYELIKKNIEKEKNKPTIVEARKYIQNIFPMLSDFTIDKTINCSFDEDGGMSLEFTTLIPDDDPDFKDYTEDEVRDKLKETYGSYNFSGIPGTRYTKINYLVTKIKDKFQIEINYNTGYDI